MKYDLIIIGAGPAGYVAAIRAGQLGLKTAVIEKENVGGMCLNWGCIPSKAMMESAKLYQKIIKDASKFGITGIDKKVVSFDWNKAIKRASTIVKKLTGGVDFLLKKNNVDVINGTAKIISENSITVENRTIEAKNIIIATGTFPRAVGKDVPHDKVIEIKELFSERVIPEKLVIVGQNPVAIEAAQLMKFIGKEVTLIVPNNRIMPLADDYLADYMLKKIKKDKIKVIFYPDVENLKVEENKLIAGDDKIQFDAIINAQMRQAIIPNSSVKIETENGFIKTDENCKTNFDSIYAVGDVNGKSYYAHIGSAQGLFVVNLINGVKGELDIQKYPLNMYSVPEVAQIGKTEQILKAEEINYKINEFPLSANGKALTEGTTDGFLRILSDTKYGEVLGVQIVAPNATDLIAEASAYMQLESTVYDIANTVHAHPTISEVFMEAGFDAIDQAIHK
jgi:dihydrolipoamide dehydrogenase